MDERILQAKRQHIFNAALLGMGLHKSMIMAECTEEEMAYLYNDASFMAEVNRVYTRKEFEILGDLQEAMDMELSQGKTSTARWMLAHLNPKRWGDGDDSKSPIAAQKAGTINNNTYNYSLKDMSKDELKELLGDK